MRIRKMNMGLVSLVFLLTLCGWAGAGEGMFPADGDAWTEEGAEWKVNAYDGGCGPKYSLSYDKENKKLGKTSLRINYLFPGRDSSEEHGDYCSYICISKDFEEPIDISNFDRTVRCWIYNPSFESISIRFYLYTQDPEDSEKLIYRRHDINISFHGWKEVSFSIYEMKALRRITLYVVNNSEVADNSERFILIDGLHVM